MSAFKGTPGPWEWEGQILVRRYQKGDGNGPWLVGEWDEVILGVLDDLELATDFVEGGGRDYCDWSSNEANARLIAAAPELLSCLEMTAHGLEVASRVVGGELGAVFSDRAMSARDAIAKATGGDA